MKVLDLRCSLGHGFEGWFGSSDDFESQLTRGLVECPICSDRSITKLLSAPRLNFGSLSETGRQASAETHLPSRVPAGTNSELAARQSDEGRWLGAMRNMLANSEDVGERFPQEARRIHYGEAPERSIRGQATPEQTEALRDEGIEILAIQLPDALKETLQ